MELDGVYLALAVLLIPALAWLLAVSSLVYTRRKYSHLPSPKMSRFGRAYRGCIDACTHVQNITQACIHTHTHIHAHTHTHMYKHTIYTHSRIFGHYLDIRQERENGICPGQNPPDRLLLKW